MSAVDTLTTVKEPNDIEIARVKRFFTHLKDSPFMAVIFDGEDVHVYAKGISEEELRTIKEAFDKFAEEDGN